jgi:putative zinc finger/helix-turn-helix YgiT family protein
MKCDVCKGNTIILSGQKYHYTESGLDNVYLKDIELRLCESCGESSPRIPRILDVHAAIARAVALQPRPLRGAEIRFMRKQLGMRAGEWAGLMRVDKATFSRWENDDQQLGAQSDALLRFLYFRISEEREGKFLPDQLVARIAAVQCSQAAELRMEIDTQTRQISWHVDNEEVFAIPGRR